ncbi:glycosyltransferase [Vibrio cholerae]|uniref:glycosyltransferase n=1 Tax=Vibrio cholerae TaxID=666 RepID=UPI002DB5A6D0|nr:galactosyltransferase-related protein [Vibrio cholerae]MEB5557621.1 glycosyltransferase [Vibrio cholerae]
MMEQEWYLGTMQYEIIMAAYNDAEVVGITLEGFRRQSDSDFSLCIADDGSGPEVLAVVNKYRKKGMNIRHVWHEDQGFRKTIILNKAIASSAADRLIFVDNDGIPHRHFIADHKAHYQPKLITTGPRVYLRQAITDKLKQGTWDIQELENNWKLLWLSLFKQTKKPEMAFYFPSELLSLLSRLKLVWPYGANMAIDRTDLLAINGFDEDFLGWGGEDIDLIRRLQLIGVAYFGCVGRAIVYHLEHQIRIPNDGNAAMAEHKRIKLNSATFYAENGLNKWLASL